MEQSFPINCLPFNVSNLSCRRNARIIVAVCEKEKIVSRKLVRRVVPKNINTYAYFRPDSFFSFLVRAKCGKRNSAGKRVAPRFIRWTKFHHSSQPLERLNEIRRSGGRNAPFDRHFGGARLSRKSRRIPVPERHHHLPLSPLLPSSNYSTTLIRSPFLFPSRVDNQAGEFPRIATTFRVPCSSLDRRPRLDEIGIREDGSKGRGGGGKYFGRGKNWKKPAARSLIDISIEFR